MPTMYEIKSRINEISATLRGIADVSEAEDRDLSEEERSTWASHETELRSLQERAERRQTVEKVDNWLEEPATPAPPAELEPPRRAPAVHVRNSRPYSLVKAFQAMASGDRRAADIETRASDEISERTGKTPDGMFIPYRALLSFDDQQKAVAREAEYRDVTKASTGAELVGTDLIPSEFIELLRNESVVVGAGARLVPNLVGDVDIPRQNAAATASWLVAETTTLSTDTTFDMNKLSLSPKTVGIRADVSRKMLKQSTPGIEEIIREDIRQVIGLAVDTACINGDSGSSSGQPDGILQTTGIGTVDAGSASSQALDFAKVCEFEADLGAANALRGRLAYATNSSIASTLKQTARLASTAMGFISEGGQVNGYPLIVSQQIPANTVIFGNWAEVLIGMWGVLDLQADPYTLGDSGSVVFRGFQDMDVGVRHAASFSVCTDAA